MTERLGDGDGSDRPDERSTDRAAESRERGIPPEMEEGESKGLPHDDRLQSEVSHGRPDEAERSPTGEG